MMEWAKPGDKEALVELFHLCFPGEEDFCRWYFGRLWQPGQTLVCRRAEGIVAMLQLLHRRIQRLCGGQRRLHRRTGPHRG